MPAHLIASLPHSGEQIPSETPWLAQLPEPLLMQDVDRFVDGLYIDTLRALGVPFVTTVWHRYAVDLNRTPQDIDQDSVKGAIHPAGTFPRGFHWSMTTLREKLMPGPMDFAVHQVLVTKYYEPFHRELRGHVKVLRQKDPTAVIYHLDLHSMPSVGTSEHRDPGERRADIVVSDSKGKSSSPDFKQVIVDAYEREGFSVRVNWPYYGGRITEQYGRPDQGHHTVQVELNRALYMDEKTKRKLDTFSSVADRLGLAVGHVHRWVSSQRRPL